MGWMGYWRAAANAFTHLPGTNWLNHFGGHESSSLRGIAAQNEPKRPRIRAESIVFGEKIPRISASETRSQGVHKPNALTGSGNSPTLANAPALDAVATPATRSLAGLLASASSGVDAITTPLRPLRTGSVSRPLHHRKACFMLIHHDLGHLGPLHGQRLAVSQRFSRTACAQCVEPTPARRGTAEYGGKTAKEPIGHDVPTVNDGTKAAKEPTPHREGTVIQQGPSSPPWRALGDSAGVGPASASEAL